MVEKIKANISKITVVSAIVSCALIVPSLLSMIDSSFTETTIINIIYYALLIGANVLLITTCKGGKGVTPALLVYCSARLLTSTYNLINGTLSSIAYIVLFLALIALSFCKGEKAHKGLFLVYLIAIAFALASALSGGVVGLSLLLTTLVLFGNVYLNNKEE